MILSENRFPLFRIMLWCARNADHAFSVIRRVSVTCSIGHRCNDSGSFTKLGAKRLTSSRVKRERFEKLAERLSS